MGINDYLELLPSRCDLSDDVCRITCNAIGRKNGVCEETENGKEDCECSDERISPSEFALCAAESTCRADCQRRGKASGRCDGWSCQCLSEDPNELYEN